MSPLLSQTGRPRVSRRVALLAASVALALPGTVVVGALIGSPVAAAAEYLSQTFNYNDSTQYFTVPAGVALLDLTASGGQGGSGTFAAAGGPGAQISETVAVSAGDTLVVEVGGAGGDAGSSGSGGSGGLSSGDGMNGGTGGATNYLVDGGPGGGGGGGTEVVDATTGRVLIAAAGGGGGGGEDGLSDVDGGSGGPGGSGSVVYPGQGGTSRYGDGGAGGPGGISGSSVGADGGTPQQSTTSGGGGGGGGGYYVPSLFGGGGDGGAGGGWAAYQSGGGGGGGGASFTPSFAVNIQPSTSSGNGQVTLSWTAPRTATSTTLGFAPSSVVVGQSYSVSATVTGASGAAATGPVQFSSNGSVMGTADLNGASPDVATWTATAASEAGSVSWQATYLGDNGAPGDPGDTSSTSPVETVTVGRGQAPITLSTSPDPVAPGKRYSLTATVAGFTVNPTGTVVFKTDAGPATSVTLVPQSNGHESVATFTATAPRHAGSAPWIATYNGDRNYTSGASNTVTETVQKGSGPPPVVMASSPASGYAGTTVTITGSNLSGAKVFFGSTPAKKVKCPSATRCTAIAPKGGSGTVDISAVTSHGRSVLNSDATFSYFVP